MKFSWEMTEDEKKVAAAAKAAAFDAAIAGLEKSLNASPEQMAARKRCLDGLFGPGNWRVVYPAW